VEIGQKLVKTWTLHGTKIYVLREWMAWKKILVIQEVVQRADGKIVGPLLFYG